VATAVGVDGDDDDDDPPHPQHRARTTEASSTTRFVFGKHDESSEMGFMCFLLSGDDTREGRSRGLARRVTLDGPSQGFT
jgi:hypothetical protein